MSKRAERRAIRAKLIERVRRIARDFWHYEFGRDDYPERPRYRANWAEKGADHPDDCNHWYCKSPRKWGKGRERLTIQEKKAEDSANDKETE